MFQIIVKLIAILICFIGVVLIYDARIITKKFFGFGDQNEATQRIKNIRLYYCNYWWINILF